MTAIAGAAPMPQVASTTSTTTGGTPADGAAFGVALDRAVDDQSSQTTPDQPATAAAVTAAAVVSSDQAEDPDGASAVDAPDVDEAVWTDRRPVRFHTSEVRETAAGAATAASAGAAEDGTGPSVEASSPHALQDDLAATVDEPSEDDPAAPVDDVAQDDPAAQMDDAGQDDLAASVDDGAGPHDQTAVPVREDASPSQAIPAPAATATQVAAGATATAASVPPGAVTTGDPEAHVASIDTTTPATAGGPTSTGAQDLDAAPGDRAPADGWPAGRGRAAATSGLPAAATAGQPPAATTAQGRSSRADLAASAATSADGAAAAGGLTVAAAMTGADGQGTTAEGGADALAGRDVAVPAGDGEPAHPSANGLDVAGLRVEQSRATQATSQAASVRSGAPQAPPPPPAAAQVATAVAAMRRATDGIYEAAVELNPAELGRVNVELRVRDGVVDVRMIAEQQSTRALLHGQLDDLRRGLSEDGLQAGQLDVSQQDLSDQDLDRRDLRDGDLGPSGDGGPGGRGSADAGADRRTDPSTRRTDPARLPRPDTLQVPVTVPLSPTSVDLRV